MKRRDDRVGGIGGRDDRAGETGVGDDRAVSSAVTYSFIVIITLVLTGGLVVGTDALINDQRQQVVTDQLDVVGQRMAATIETADRLSATTNDPDSLAITREFPQRLAGSAYQIRVDHNPSSSDYTLYVETVDGDLSIAVRVSVSSASGIGETTVAGGETRVRYEPSSDELVVEDA
jgi:hypothetical protein